ncbi:PspC domain-containing protein [Pseudotenacibaculum sp. MALMAid0570]|uniref:PspC domain-containing protein n=1 Tax=Pseudotenacibaculum sp. MALMAid0570 TaxID=3143938 RepID=UPI0032DFDB50
MNKTININLGGYFFHIDENAYQKLRRYLDAIAKSLSDDPQGKNEIISDIETRISELLSEKITDARQVVNEQDISDVIKIMGEPEDYADTEEGYTDNSYKYSKRQTSSKKLFRDGDDKFLGGVAAGIAHYFDVDVIWIRLAFIILLFSGFSILLYIILWILLPEAKTTAEKLQMEGEPVNIDNIEKKIREELGTMTEKIKDGANEVTKKVNEGVKKNGKRAKSGFQDFLDTLGNIITSVFKVIGKFIGVIIIITSAAVLISFILAIFSIGSFEVLGFGDDFLDVPPFMHDSVLPHWLLAICALILAGFPFLILFILGLRILSSNVKQFSKTTSLTLLGIWIVALLLVVFSGIEYGTSNAYNGNKSETKNLYLENKDTLNLKMVNDDDLYYKSRLRRSSRRVEVYDGDKRKTYCSYIKVDVEKSDVDEVSIKVRKVSEGRNRNLANKNAEQLEYKYELNDNTLTLDAYFLSNSRHLLKDEAIYVTIYIPENSVIYFDESTQNFLHGIYDVDGMYDSDMAEHYFLMTSEGLDCTDCEVEEALKDLGIKKTDSLQ